MWDHNMGWKSELLSKWTKNSFTTHNDLFAGFNVNLMLIKQLKCIFFHNDNRQATSDHVFLQQLLYLHIGQHLVWPSVNSAVQIFSTLHILHISNLVFYFWVCYKVWHALEYRVCQMCWYVVSWLVSYGIYCVMHIQVPSPHGLQNTAAVNKHTTHSNIKPATKSFFS